MYRSAIEISAHELQLLPASGLRNPRRTDLCRAATRSARWAPPPHRGRRLKEGVAFRAASGIQACAASLALLLVPAPSAASNDDSLVVFAASSVADVLREIAEEFEARSRVTVVVSQGSSGQLSKQIQLGADCDLFVPADAEYLTALQKENLVIASTRTEFARNRLIVIAAGPGRSPWSDPSHFEADDAQLIALADPDHAPAGAYARQALERHGLWNRLQPRIRYSENVRFAAKYVAENAAGIGIVYETDARAFADRVSVVYRFDQRDHSPITYEGAVCTRSSNPQLARAFLQFAAGDDCAAIWTRHGFLIADAADDAATAPHHAQDPGDGTILSARDIHAIRLSLQISVVATLLFLIPGILVGTWLAQTRSRWRAMAQTFVNVPLVLPPVVTGLCVLLLLVRLNSPLRFTWWAAVFASGLVSWPLMVRTVRAGVEAMNPRLLHAAATLGASRMRAFITVTLPLCWPAIVGGVVLFFARAMGEFGAVIVAAGSTPGRTQTIPLAIYSNLESSQQRSIWPLVVVSLLISLAAIAASEWLIREKRRPRAPADRAAEY